jgi:hypothetical protein
MIRVPLLPKRADPILVDDLQFDFSEFENRFGLPIVSCLDGELPIFDVPAYVEPVPGISETKILRSWGAELATMSMFFCRDFNTTRAESGRPSLNKDWRLSSGVDFPQFLFTKLRLERDRSIYFYFMRLSLWLEHGAVCDSSLINASELDALTNEISEKRLRAILRGEQVPDLCIKYSQQEFDERNK